MKTSATPATEIETWKPEVVVIVADPKQIEIMQSAEIVYRELKARGVRAVFDDVATGKITAALRLNLSDRSLRDGAVELQTAQRSQLVSLEDVAEKALEVLRD